MRDVFICDAVRTPDRPIRRVARKGARRRPGGCSHQGADARHPKLDWSAVDEVYFESPYFVAPADGDDQTYAVIRDALRDSGKVGIGQLAIGGRERLCSLKPFGSGMLLETLRYEDEIKDTDPYFEQLEDLRGRDEEIDLALELIKRKSRTFNPGEFKDHYRLALKELIDARLEHRAPEPVVEERPEPKVVNLMDALRQSLRQQDAPDKPAERRTRTDSQKKRAPAKPVHKRKAG